MQAVIDDITEIADCDCYSLSEAIGNYNTGSMDHFKTVVGEWLVQEASDDTFRAKIKKRYDIFIALSNCMRISETMEGGCI
jgi:hypothetical protein